MEPNVIDRLREQIQERLDQLAGEADRLRKALAALDPRSSKTPTRKPPLRKSAQRAASKPTVSATKSAGPANQPAGASLPTPDGARCDQGLRRSRRSPMARR